MTGLQKIVESHHGGALARRAHHRRGMLMKRGDSFRSRYRAFAILFFFLAACGAHRPDPDVFFEDVRLGGSGRIRMT